MSHKTRQAFKSWIRHRWVPLIAMLAIAGTWAAIEGLRALQRAGEARDVAAVGGVVVFDEPEKSDKAMVTPELFRKAVGEKYYQEVAAVDFATDWGNRTEDAPSKITNDDLAMLAKFKGARTLELGNNPDITDDGLSHLDGMEVRVLYLYRTGIRGPGLQHVAKLPNLMHLDLLLTEVGDDGLAHLVGIKTLRSLELSNTKITDAGLQHVASMEGLEDVRLRNMDITDEGLRALHSATKLKKITLSGTNVTA